jgi:hypothetical protein
LLRGGRVDQLRDLLRRVHDSLVTALDVPGLLRGYRPAELEGKAAEPYWQNLTDLITRLEPYADDSARDSLTELLWDRVMRDSAPGEDGHRPPRSPVPVHDLVQAATLIARPSPGQLELLFDRLRRLKPDRYNPWWQLFTQRTWETSEVTVARMAFEFAISLEQPELLPTAAELVAPILDRFHDFDAAAAAWATRHEAAFQSGAVWWIFLNRRVEGVAHLMPGWTQAVVGQLVTR